MEKRVSPEIDSVMSEKTPFSSIGLSSGLTGGEGTDKYSASVVFPIVSEGDAIGSVIFIADEEEPGEIESKLAESAAGFLGKHMEG